MNITPEKTKEAKEKLEHGRVDLGRLSFGYQGMSKAEVSAEIMDEKPFDDVRAENMDNPIASAVEFFTQDELYSTHKGYYVSGLLLVCLDLSGNWRVHRVGQTWESEMLKLVLQEEKCKN